MSAQSNVPALYDRSAREEVRCPACTDKRDEHSEDGCHGSSWLDGVGYLDCECSLTPAEIDTILAMRAEKAVKP